MIDTVMSLVARDRPMVVAFRDQATGPDVLRWAARRGQLTGQHITVLNAVPDALLVTPVAAGGVPYGRLIAGSRQLLDEASRSVCLDYPDAHVTANVHSGDIVDALVSLSEDASLLVVGADRRDQRNGEYLGSVGQQVALGSVAPVVVIPRKGHDARWDSGSVVVGVDGSAESHTALRVAAAESSRSNQKLVVVTAASATFEKTDDDFEKTDDDATALVLTELQSAYPELVVTRIIDSHQPPNELLAFHANGASLLVIGRHGRGARPGVLLGSVTHTLLLDPQCPTLVVTRREPQ